MIYFKLEQHDQYRKALRNLRDLPDQPECESLVNKALDKLDPFSETLRQDLIEKLDADPELWSEWLDLCGGDPVRAVKRIGTLASNAKIPRDIDGKDNISNSRIRAKAFAVILSLVKHHGEALAAMRSDIDLFARHIVEPLARFLLDEYQHYPSGFEPKSVPVRTAFDLLASVGKDGYFSIYNFSFAFDELVKRKWSARIDNVFSGFAAYLEKHITSCDSDPEQLLSMLFYRLTLPTRKNFKIDALAALPKVFRIVAKQFPEKKSNDLLFTCECLANYHLVRELAIAKHAGHIPLANALGAELAALLPAEGRINLPEENGLREPEYHTDWRHLPSADRFPNLAFWEPMTLETRNLLLRIGVDCPEVLTKGPHELVSFANTVSPREAFSVLPSEVWDELVAFVQWGHRGLINHPDNSKEDL